MTNYVGFGQAIGLYFKNYGNFSGRSSRSEYWWMYLANMIVSVVLNIFSYTSESMATVAFALMVIWALATFIPGLALLIRRLHDTGKSGWYILITLIPLVGPILMLVQVLKDSEGRNQWGPPPGETR